MKFAKINRQGYPANTICKVVKHGAVESTIELPDKTRETLFTAFLYEDLETKRHTKAVAAGKSAEFLAKHPPRRR